MHSLSIFLVLTIYIGSLIVIFMGIRELEKRIEKLNQQVDEQKKVISLLLKQKRTRLTVSTDRNFVYPKYQPKAVVFTEVSDTIADMVKTVEAIERHAKLGRITSEEKIEELNKVMEELKQSRDAIKKNKQLRYRTPYLYEIGELIIRIEDLYNKLKSS